MKIVHIAPNAPYNEGWGYQDNLLPKYHKKLGHDVTLIITNTMHKDGKIVETECEDYVNNEGVRVIRLKRKKYFNRILTNIRSKMDVYQLLKEIKPDFIFFHGLLGTTIYDVVKYKKRINPNCKIVRDNHLDYNNSVKCITFKNFIIRAFYRFYNKRTIKYVDKVYGVTPWRKTYAEDYFKIPKNKTDVLIMGADDEKIDYKNKNLIRERIRNDYGVKNHDFLIVTGGKIDEKKKITLLMEAVKNFSNVKLLIFGNIANEIKDEFDSLIKANSNIIYIGWIAADKVYNYFLSAELIVFPGGHSVMWEQACACGVPGIYKEWEGMKHVDVGGNVMFLPNVSVETIKNALSKIVNDKDFYNNMKKVAEAKADEFLYSKIAKKAIGIDNED